MYEPDAAIDVVDQLPSSAWRQLKMVWKTAMTTIDKNDRSPQGMQEDSIEPPGPKRRSRRLIRCLRADLRRPLPAFRHVLQHRQLQRGFADVRS